MLSIILNLPRKLLAHGINLLLAIPLTFIGILLRALAEWLNKDNRAPIAEEPINTEYLEAIEYLKAELAKQEAAIEESEGASQEDFERWLEEEDDGLWDIEVELDNMENLGDEDDGEKTIH